MKPKNTDLFGGIFMIMTSLFFWTQMGKFTLYAKIFPRAIIVLLFLTGLALVLKGIIKPSYVQLFNVEQKLKMILVGVISLAWILLVEKIGFVVTSVLALGMLMWVLNDKKNVKNLLTSYLIAGGEVGVLYFVFAKLLYVPFPKGLLF